MKRNLISALITMTVLIIVGVVVFPQFTSYDSVLDTIAQLDGNDVGLILTFTGLNILVYAWPFMAATPGIRFWPSFLLRQTSFLLSNAFPGGGAIGIGVQYAMAASYGVKGAVASSGILSTSIWNILTTMSLPGISLIIVWLAGQQTTSNPVAGLLGIIVAFVSIGGFILIMRSKALTKRLAGWIDKRYEALKSRISFLPKAEITKSLLDFRKATYSTTTKRWPILILSNLAQQIAQYAVLLVILILLQSDPVPIALTFSAFAFARIGTFIPLTPGGLGTVDAILIALLVQAGISEEVAAAATLLWRATTYFPQLFIGVGTFLLWRVTGMQAKN